MKQDKSALSGVYVKLLQGFILSEEKQYWEPLLKYQETVREYFLQLGLRVHLCTEDGYAFLKAAEEDEENDEIIEAPTLIRKFPLSFDVSLLCVLLRESLEQFDFKVSDHHRLVMHQNDIYELLRFFYEDKTDETKQVRRFDATIQKLVELGFLKCLKGDANSYEVCRIIKAQIDASALSDLKDKMKAEISQ